MIEAQKGKHALSSKKPQDYGDNFALGYEKQLERLELLQVKEASLRRELEAALLLIEEARCEAVRIGEKLVASEERHRRAHSAWILKCDELRMLKSGML